MHSGVTCISHFYNILENPELQTDKEFGYSGEPGVPGTEHRQILGINHLKNMAKLLGFLTKCIYPH